MKQSRRWLGFLLAVLCTAAFSIILHLFDVFWFDPWYFYPDCVDGFPPIITSSSPFHNNNNNNHNDAAAVTIGMTLHRSNPAYQLTFQQSVQTWLPFLNAGNSTHLLLLDSVSNPPLHLEPDLAGKIMPIQRQHAQPPFHLPDEGYSFFWSTYGLLQRTNTSHFCNFNNDVLVNPDYHALPHLLRQTHYFMTDEQFYTPNICTHTRRWRAAICSFPTALVRGSVLRTTSMDQVLIRLLKARVAPQSHLLLNHISHQGSTYDRPYDHVTIRHWRIGLYWIRHFDRIQRRIDPDASLPSRAETIVPIVQSSFWKGWLEALFILMGSWPVYPVLDTLTRWSWMWTLELWILNRIGIKALVGFSIVKWVAIFYWVPVLVQYGYLKWKMRRHPMRTSSYVILPR